MNGITWIVVDFSVVALFLLLLDVTASVAVVRSDLSRMRKVAQLAVVWFVPVIGAHLVVRFLAESEPQAIPTRWIPNDAINGMLLWALGVTVREATSLGECSAERYLTHIVSDHFHGGEATAVHDSGSSGDGGGHSGH